MAFEFVTETGKYHITSHGNGWAYEVTEQSTGDNLWFQDDDALELQSQTNDFASEDAIRTYFECLLG